MGATISIGPYFSVPYIHGTAILTIKLHLKIKLAAYKLAFLWFGHDFVRFLQRGGCIDFDETLFHCDGDS